MTTTVIILLDLPGRIQDTHWQAGTALRVHRQP